MKKKLTALVLSLVIAAMPAAAPVMNVQTVSAATTKAAVLKNTWSKDHKYYYDKNGKKVKESVRSANIPISLIPNIHL